jgi:hypothetical protein
MLTGLAVGAGIAGLGGNGNGSSDATPTLWLIGFLAILIVGGLIRQLGRRNRVRDRASGRGSRGRWWSWWRT